MAHPVRLLVLFTTICRLGGALLCLAGAVCLSVEASYLKYAVVVKQGQGAYAWGDVGWLLIECGAFSIAFDGITSFLYGSVAHSSLMQAWPFYPPNDHPLRNIIRDGAMGFGFLLLALGAGSNAYVYPDVAPHQHMGAWVQFYHGRSSDKYLHNGAYLLSLGSVLLCTSIVVIAIYCERLDVFYILPCTRCHQERQITHATDEASCGCLYLDRPPPVRCALQTSCTAIYQNNFLGAFFNHVYPSYAFYFAASVFWLASLNVAFYSPFHTNNATKSTSAAQCALPHHTVYEHGLDYVCDAQERDAGFYLLVSSILFIVAATLFTIHAFIYYLSILLNRPFIVNNFPPETSHK